jgi:hypothetical protein
MINAIELHNRLRATDLSLDEKSKLSELETLTDSIITKEFERDVFAFVYRSQFDTILSTIHRFRIEVILVAWQRYYEANGWKVSYDNDTNPGWYFKIDA